jgi:uncharacterized protein
MADLLGTATPWEGEVTKDDKTWGLLSHLSAIFFAILGPLVCWLVKKDESEFVADHAKEALNFSITVTIAVLALSATCILAPLAVIIVIYALVLNIIAGMKANEGHRFTYPFAIRLIK